MSAFSIFCIGSSTETEKEKNWTDSTFNARKKILNGLYLKIFDTIKF
jgi:hypothetical protein